MMATLKVTEARANLYKLIDDVAANHQPVFITGKRSNAVLLAEEDWNAINETLSRTVMTSLTTMLALVSLYVLGGEVIRGFSFALIWGVIIGTYSSICVAVPLLLHLNVNRGVQTSGAGKQAEPAG